jgi:hypothetical protein
VDTLHKEDDDDDDDDHHHHPPKYNKRGVGESQAASLCGAR